MITQEPVMIAPNDLKTNPAQKLISHKGTRQFVKFAIVGFSSTVISFAVLNFALIILHQNKYIAATLAFAIAVVNGYYWNRLWTFKQAPQKSTHIQFTQFLIVNLVALSLNLLIIKLVSVPLEEHFHVTMVKATNYAQLVATGVLVFWNYFANRLWTFKH